MGFNPLVFRTMRQICAKYMITINLRPALALALALLLDPAFAIARPFTARVESLQPSLTLPLKLVEEDIFPQFALIEKRVAAAESDSRVEPLYLSVPRDDDDRAAFSLKLARQKKYRTLMAKLDQEIARADSSVDSKKQLNGTPGAQQSSGPGNQNNQVNPTAVEDRGLTVKIRVRPDLLRLMSPAAVTTKMKRTHIHATIDSAALLERSDLRSELMVQMASFTDAPELRKVGEKLRLALPLDVDRDVLPVVAQRAVKTFEIFRGPNCFMAALAFQYPKMVRSHLVNVKSEVDHHGVMINNDELWRALQSSFYEVDPAKSPLKFGDMIVFFQLPASDKAVKDVADSDISYRWIKHATTFLFNDLVYSKGSKSPNSPYLIGTLRSEWRAWDKHVSAGGGSMGVKVFRKPLKSATSRPPKSLDDWMY